MENPNIERIEKAGADFMKAIADLRPFIDVAIAARDLCRSTEVLDVRDACIGSISLDQPIELFALCDAVDIAFGPYDAAPSGFTPGPHITFE